MKFSALFGLALIAQTASAHYIFDTLIAGTTTSTKAVRKPAENSPITDINSPNLRCNVNTSPATETVSVAAGSKIGFKISNQKIYHLGPAAMYLGKAPGSAAEWDGGGQSWFKIAEWGAVFEPQFSFSSLDKSEFSVTIPPQVSDGEYLVRIEQVGLHQPGFPEFYLSCAQVKITNGGTGNPAMVSIPGHVSKEKDPGLTVDIYYPKPTQYTVPGPESLFSFLIDFVLCCVEQAGLHGLEEN
ncbi:glycosyl hydrolase family 61-domain-containing protein [Panaeolus papilionaceus]|nr:glycosyl hydrolase family 61-domain-containing protein [Panaeolus papilionaceus]